MEGSESTEVEKGRIEDEDDEDSEERPGNCCEVADVGTGSGDDHARTELENADGKAGV